MPHTIHARRRGNRWVYRDWSTITDCYHTPQLGPDAMTAYLIRSGDSLWETLARMERARKTGSSSYVDKVVGATGPWETERCRKCAGFHHAYRKGARGCRECGETRGDPMHGLECGDTP